MCEESFDHLFLLAHDKRVANSLPSAMANQAGLGSPIVYEDQASPFVQSGTVSNLLLVHFPVSALVPMCTICQD